jgi:transposase-like protein
VQGGKQVVFGMVERKGAVIPVHVASTSGHILQSIIAKNVKKWARIMTDEYPGYESLKEKGFQHDTVIHKSKVYVMGDVHTNTIENFWSVLKRGIHGIYHHTSKEHLQAYLHEFSLRYNTRSIDTSTRFNLILANVSGKRLTYKELINHE